MKNVWIMIKTKLVNSGKNFAVGNSYGFYTPSRADIRQVRYKTVCLEKGGTTTKNRRHAICEVSIHKDVTSQGNVFCETIKLGEVNLPRTYVDSKTPVYHQYFQGPIHCNDSPTIEKILWKGTEVFFGIVEDKLAIYSVHSNKGIREMKLYGVEKLTQEQSINKNYLRSRAVHALNNLLKNETEKQCNLKQAYEVNGVQWTNFSSQDLRKHMQGKDYVKYDFQKDTWGEDISLPDCA
jgi:hypothetical protein